MTARLGQFLISRGLLEPRDLDDALALQSRAGGRLGEPDPVVLLVVGDVVLERGDDVRGLGSGDLLGDGVTGQERVLAEVLRLAAGERCARDVHGRPEPPVEALAVGLVGDRLAGRIEPRVDRKTRTLEVVGAWGDTSRADEALASLASFLGAEAIRLP